MHEQFNHSWFAERVSAYLTGALSGEERSQFEAHAEECEACAAVLSESQAQDEAILGLFKQIAPSPDFPDKVIGRLRDAGRPKFSLRQPIRLSPRVMRAAGAVAAIIVLGGLGYGGTYLLLKSNSGDRIAASSPSTEFDAKGMSWLDLTSARPTAASNLRQIGQAELLRNDIPVAGMEFVNSARIDHAMSKVAPLSPNSNLVATQTPSAPPVTLDRDRSRAAYSYWANPIVRTLGDVDYFRPAAPPAPTAGEDTASTPEQVASAIAPSSTTADTNLLSKSPLPANGPTDKDDHAKQGENVLTQDAPTTAPQPMSRQIIRHGEMSFEVDSFDSSFMQITKIAAEEGGFISDTNSEKLDNGKMSGTVTVRVPPDHLDTLTLKLRALGDLKGQKITAEDVSKEYTDLQSELRAAQAMEERLMDIIKNGKGQVKDLLAAEKEVGVWREKVEQVTGQINYYNNLISLSTLEISLTERDIRQAALASERETVDMGIETEDVEKARADALAALDAAKARIIQADIKKLDAGQLAATIVAEVSPDASGPIIDHLKQLGRVARMDINRQQTVADNATVPPGVKVERLETQLQISLYNLANVSPRQMTNLSIACPDVETAYHAIVAQVIKAGGRVVNSNLNRVKPDQTDGVISFESPRDLAVSVLIGVRAQGEVMHLAVTENPDAANVTDAKEGFAVTLVSLATVAPRESISETLMPGGKLASAYQAIRAAAVADHANITAAQFQEQISQADSATLNFDVSRQYQGDIENAISKAIGITGRLISRQNARSDDTEHTLDSKVAFNLTLASDDALQARETTTRVLAVADVSGAYSSILGAAQNAGAKIVAAALDQSNPANPTGQLDVVISRESAPVVEKAIADAKAASISRSITRSADLNGTTEEKVELKLTLCDQSQLPPRQTTTMTVNVSDPDSASSDLQATAVAAGGRVVEQHLVQSDRYEAHLVLEVPLAKGLDVVEQARNAGTVQAIEKAEDQTVPDADFALARIDVTLNASGSIVGPQAGLWTGLKSGLGASVRGLAYSLELVVIGICLVLPWALLGWGGWRVFLRIRRKNHGSAISQDAPPA